MTEKEKAYFQPLRPGEIVSLNYWISLTAALEVFLAENPPKPKADTVTKETSLDSNSIQVL